MAYRELWVIVMRDGRGKWKPAWIDLFFTRADAKRFLRDTHEPERFRIVRGDITFETPEAMAARLKRKVPTCPACGSQYIHTRRDGRIASHVDLKWRRKGLLMKCQVRAKPIMAARSRYKSVKARKA